MWGGFEEVYIVTLGGNSLCLPHIFLINFVEDSCPIWHHAVRPLRTSGSDQHSSNRTAHEITPGPASNSHSHSDCCLT